MAPIHEAVFKGNLKRVRALLNQGVPVNNRSIGHGLTPLHYAAHVGRPNIVQELLRRGARVNPRSSFFGQTPLHFASRYAGSPRTIHALMKAGAKPKYKNTKGRTPYKFSIFKSNRNALKTSRPATKWLETTKKRKLDRQKVAALMALSPLPLNIKRRILSNAGLKKISIKNYLKIKL